MNLKEIRTKLKLSQQEFADKVGISIFSVQNIEQGQRKGSSETWNKIQNFLNKDNISYDSEDLIEEIKADIEEFGGDELCYLEYEFLDNHLFFIDYDYCDEIKAKENCIIVNLKSALEILRKQDRIVK